jgi:hypothetical protein
MEESVTAITNVSKRQTHHRLLSYQNDGGRTENKLLPPSSDLKDAEYFRNRAEEARALAEAMEDAHTKSLMLGMPIVITDCKIL